MKAQFKHKKTCTKSDILTKMDSGFPDLSIRGQSRPGMTSAGCVCHTNKRNKRSECTGSRNACEACHSGLRPGIQTDMMSVHAHTDDGFYRFFQMSKKINKWLMLLIYG